MSLSQGTLSLWDICTLTPVWNWPPLHVEEFLLTTEAESPSSVTWYVMTLVAIALLWGPGFLPGSDLIVTYRVLSSTEQTDRVKTISLSARFAENRRHEPSSDCVRMSVQNKQTSKQVKFSLA